MIDPKYVRQFTYTPIAKHIIATNKLPQINDQTKATYGRLLVVPFRNVIPKEEWDRQLIDKLKAEIPGIVAWAMEGARALIRGCSRSSPKATSCWMS